MSINRVAINYFIIFSGIIVFLIKWSYSFLLFTEDINVKIIFEALADGYKYFPLFKYFSELNLDISYNNNISDLSSISVPFGSFYIHFLFNFFFKSWSFLIVELISIILFLGIFYKISRLLSFKRLESFLISFFLFNLPAFLELLSLSTTNYISVIYSDFYNLRFPRPQITNLFFYYFIVIVLNILNKGKLVKRKKFVLLGVIMGLSFTSFPYHFLLESITLLICLIHIYKKNFLNYLTKNYISLVFFTLSFLVISSPSLINFIFVEKDFLERMGSLDLDLKKKKILFNYLIEKTLDIKFILLIITAIFLYFHINFSNFKKILFKNKFFIFLFFSSIFSPFVFIIFSPSYFSHFYFFNNLIVISFFLLVFFTLSKLIQKYLLENILNKSFNYFSIIFLILMFSLQFLTVKKNYIISQADTNTLKIRLEFNEIANIVHKKNIQLNKSSLLTFDNKIMVWFMLNDIKELKIVNGLFVPRKNEILENDLVGTFKYLGLDENDLKNFIQNEKKGYRYRNENIINLFWGRYQANSLTTYKNSIDFDKPILDYIRKSSPIMSQQIVVPNFEINRLLEKLKNHNQNYSNPDMIILNLNDPIIFNSKIDLKIFCKIFTGDHYVFYVKRNSDNKCS